MKVFCFQSKNGTIEQVKDFKGTYENLWTIPDNNDYENLWTIPDNDDWVEQQNEFNLLRRQIEVGRELDIIAGVGIGFSLAENYEIDLNEGLMSIL